MNNKMYFSILFFFVINLMPWGVLQAQVKVETSALPIFWEVADTLSADKTPSAELWAKFASHPAYVQIQRSGNRVKFLKRVLPIVFRPSKAEKLKEVLEGDETIYQFLAEHLLEAKTRREELELYLKPDMLEAYKNSYTKSLDYLPEDIKRQNIDLTIHIALFEDNGFGGKVITVDLLKLMKDKHAENMDFFAHEFHHALLRRSTSNIMFELSDSIYAPIIQALNKLPLEGVASMIDKRKYFNKAYYLNMDSMNRNQQETIIEFRGLVADAPKNLAQMDTILSGDLSYEEKGKQLFQTMPWGGHTIGYYIANAIEKAFGREKLIEVQYSCIDYILTYQAAANKDATLYSFSDSTIRLVRSIR